MTRTSTIVIGFAAADRALGRTAAISNVAWILALAGRRVLVVDWTGEDVRTQDYLGPFDIGTRKLDDQEDASGLVDGEPSTGDVTVTRYAVPTGSGRIEVLELPPGPDDDVMADAMIDAWHRRLRHMDYDYVLIDTPLDGWSAGARPVTVRCDIVAVFSTLGRRAISRAHELAKGLLTAVADGPTIVPVAVRVDHRDDRVQRSLDSVRATFREMIDTNRAADLPVELPYFPDELDNHTLAALVEDPADPAQVLSGYVHLASTTTDGRVTALAPVPEATRQRYLARLGTSAVATAGRITVVHAGADRSWAEWVEGRVGQAGVEVERRSADDPWADDSDLSVVVIESPALVGSPAEDHIARTIATGSDHQVDILRLSVTASQESAAAESSTTRILVGDQDEPDVSAELLGHFGLFGALGAESVGSIRWPGKPIAPERCNLPPRNPDFAGRERELDALRDQLRSGVPRLSVSGDPGVGKSELVKEYAHRFAYEYDLVWWVPGHGTLATRASLTQLADRLVGTETGDPVGALLTELASGTNVQRWLLVFDNFDDPADFRGMLPSGGPGQVIFTSRDDATEPGAVTLPLTAFDVRECTELFLARTPTLTLDDAERVASVVGRTPLTVAMAAACLGQRADALRRGGAPQELATHTAVELFLAELEQIDPTELADMAPYEVATAQVLAVVLGELKESRPGRVAVWLAQMCAYLSPGGVSLRLLRSTPMLDQLRSGTGKDGEFLKDNAAALDVVLRTGERSGLFTIVWRKRPQLRMHRVLQYLLRTTVTSQEDRAAWHRRVLLGLAGYAPTEVELDLPEAKEKIDELQRHIIVSAALDSDEVAVRRWIVNHTRFIHRHSDSVTWQFAVDIAEKVLNDWQARFGTADQLALRLQAQIANLRRRLGQYPAALAADEKALVEQRKALGLQHLETLMSARGAVGDLWYLGRFDEALVEAGEVYHGFRAQLGDDHPETMMAAHNFAVVTHLSGDTQQALAIQQQHYERHVRLFGSQHEGSYVSAVMCGIYLRETGQLLKASRITTAAHDGLKTPDRRPTDTTLMWVTWMLGVVRSRRGKEPARLLLEPTAQAYAEMFPESHLNTLGCRLSLAGEYHRNQRRSAKAAAIANECLDRYESAHPGHPYTDVCRMNLALYLRGASDLTQAEAHGRLAMENLRQSVGETHPWTLLAAANYATLLAASQDPESARTLARTTLTACRELLRTRHPYTRLAEAALDRIQNGPDAVSAERWPELDIDVVPSA